MINSRPDGGNGAGYLMTEHRGERKRDRTLLHVQVGMAHSAARDPNEHLARPQYRIAELLDTERSTGFPNHYRLHDAPRSPAPACQGMQCRRYHRRAHRTDFTARADRLWKVTISERVMPTYRATTANRTESYQMDVIEHWMVRRGSGSASQTSPVFNPATGEQSGQVHLASASADDVDVVVRSAASAFTDWSQSALARRTKILFAFRELLNSRAQIISAEHGKVISDAFGEVRRSLEVVEYACGIPTLLKGGYCRPGLLRRGPALLP